MRQSKIIFGRIKHIYSYHWYNINSYIIQVLSTTSEYHIGVRYYQMNPCAAICCVSVNIFKVNGKVFMIAFQIWNPELTDGQVKACTPSLRDGVDWRKTQCNISANFFLYFILVFSKCVVTVMTPWLVLYSDLCSLKKKEKNNKQYAFKKLANILQQHGQIMYFCLMLGTTLIYAFVTTQSPGTLIWSISTRIRHQREGTAYRPWTPKRILRDWTKGWHVMSWYDNGCVITHYSHY